MAVTTAWFRTAWTSSQPCHLGHWSNLRFCFIVCCKRRIRSKNNKNTYHTSTHTATCDREPNTQEAPRRRFEAPLASAACVRKCVRFGGAGRAGMVMGRTGRAGVQARQTVKTDTNIIQLFLHRYRYRQFAETCRRHKCWRLFSSQTHI